MGYRYKDDHNAEYGMFLISSIADDIGIEYKDIKEAEQRIDRAVYKGTDCGAWVKFDEQGIVVGSIVEGSDAEFSERIDLKGIDMSEEGSAELCKRFWDTLDKINVLACDRWYQENEDFF